MSENSTAFPGDDWEARSPESQGVDRDGLDDAMGYLGENAGGNGVSETVVIRNGYMIWRGSDIGSYHTVNSCTKTFTTALLGLLIQDGKCTLDTAATEHVPGLADRYPLYSRITLRHLASMTSGYDGEKGAITEEQKWGDPGAYLTPTAPLFAAGAAYKYHDPAIHLLGCILTRMAGEPLKDLFERRIGDLIGLTRWEWKALGLVDGIPLNSPSGIYEGGVHITPTDMARFGHLYLNRGNWEGRQLIDASWIDLATTTQVPAALPYRNMDRTGRFGFMWWTNGMDRFGKRPWPSAPPATYTAHGGNRNFCFVIPEWKMVIVRMEGSAKMPRSTQDQIWDVFFGKLDGALLQKC